MSYSIVYESYLRKSSEPDDRQVLSIPAQKAECTKSFPELHPIKINEESYSAKAPGRLIFDKMISRIKKGEVSGIIAWHPDRLARNSVDSGEIIYLLDTGLLKDLKFCTYTFENTPEGKWMLSMIMSQAKYFVDKLSKDVKRGNNTKYSFGGVTWNIGQGYIPNLLTHSQEPDPERFELVRKMWDMLLSGVYTVPQIRRTANEEWGYRTRQTAKQGGKPLSDSMLYEKIFKNERYYGLNRRPDGTEFWCKHKPMISEEEYWRAQAILGKRGRPKNKRKDGSPYTDGLIKCGECGCSITVDPKTKHLKNGRVIHYEYYRCTKKRGVCTQPYITKEDLESQLGSVLEKLNIGKNVGKWMVEYLGDLSKNEEIETQKIYESQHRTIEIINKELFNLTTMLRKELICEEEFTEQRALLLNEREQVRQSADGNDYRVEKWLELAEAVILFGSQCGYWLKNGTYEDKKLIAQTVFGSNLTLFNKQITAQPVGPFKIMAQQGEQLRWQGY